MLDIENAWDVYPIHMSKLLARDTSRGHKAASRGCQNAHSAAPDDEQSLKSVPVFLRDQRAFLIVSGAVIHWLHALAGMICSA